jgi:hypothetical protein
MKRMGLIIAALGIFLFAQVAQADWTPAQRLTWTSGDSYTSDIAVDSGDTVHIAWSDQTPGNHEIYYKRSTDGGIAWSAVQRLTWTSGDSYRPSMGIDLNNTIHIIWNDYTPGNFEIYYKKGT